MKAFYIKHNAFVCGAVAIVVVLMLAFTTTMLPRLVQASIFVGNTTSVKGNENPLTFSLACTGSDRVLVVAVSRATNSAPSSVTYNGTDLTMAVQNGTGLGNYNISMWYLIDPDAGAHDVVVSAGHDKAASAICITGANGVGGAVNQFKGNSDQISKTLSVQGASGIVVDAVMWQKADGSAGSNQTAFGLQRSWTIDGVDYYDMTNSYEGHSGSNVNMSWSDGASQVRRMVALEIIEGVQTQSISGDNGILMGMGF